ncbi:CHAT domain-containing protein [Reichenbachiella carrageenanivorans]|uniref:CHAT domain-containing protein n=1 Tax=Reichenbachiella carrageenanivorans TaxID=2979869 RepID=A0ABY6CUR2_9BACT|nr:CHAT domain-containing protein [Reichenbachiella carrageenanivorans]UXX77661.1 CHAT domain-containing protein [Reichenbachiella carrageenanivorans]
MKKVKQSSLLIILLILIGTSSFAQTKYDKKMEKAADLYEVGDYSGARNEIEKIKKKSTKQIGGVNEFLPIARIKEAKYDVALGILSGVHQSVAEGLEMSIVVNGPDSEVHALLLKESTEVMVLYGDFLKAKEYLDQARPILLEAGMDENLAASIDVLDAQIKVGRGFYTEAIELINGKMDFYQGRAMLDDGAKKAVERERKREFARMMMFKGDAYRRMGNYLSADSAFVYADNWIQKNLGKADILYSENQYLNTLLLEENGLEIGAVVDLYEKAYLHTVRKYQPSHYVTVQIRERLIKSYIKNDNKAKLSNHITEFKKIIKQNYDKNSLYSVMLETIDYDVLLGGKDVGLENDVAEILGAESVIPKNHIKRIEMLEFANSVAVINGRSDNSFQYINQILEIKKVLYGEESPEYNLTKIKLANYYVDYTEKFAEALEIYNTSWDKIVKKEIHEGHLDYVDILDHQAVFYEENDEYAKASEILDIALEASRRKYDNEDVEYAIELDKIANLQFKIGEYAEAEKNINEALQILEKADRELAGGYYAQSLVTQATLFAIKGEYDEAESNISKSEKLKKAGVRTIETSGIEIEDELAEVYLAIGRYRDAEKLIEHDLKKKERRFGANSRHMNDPLILKARLKMIMGDYTMAEQLANRAYNITFGIFGGESSKITPSLVTLANINTTIGDYDVAASRLEQVIEIREKQFGRDHIDVARAVSDLALVRFYNDAPTEEVEDLFLRAEKIVGKKLGGSNPHYADVLKNLAVVYVAERRFDEAFVYLEDAANIWDRRIGSRNNINSAAINILRGDIYYSQHQYGEALGYYDKAKDLYEDFFSKSHPEYVKALSKMSKTYFMQGDIKRSQESIEEVLANYSVFIKEYFPSLSEREKAKFWNTIKQDYEFYNTIVINYNKKNTELVGSLYNNALLTKALLLSSSIKIRQRILSSGDETLISTYREWEAKKETLTQVLSMSTEQMAQSGLDGNLLQTEVEDLEKQLSQQSEDFSSGFDSKVVTWEDVQRSLNPNEVALEMVRFRVFDHSFSNDSIMYAVMYVKNEKNSTPGMILLKNGKDMESKYLKLYRNSIKFRLDDQKSYDNFWRPIQDVIGNPGRIYVSADGVYNQLNLEAIKLADGTYVLDRSNIILISNTKDLYYDKITTNVVQEANTAEMFGNPTYYVSTKPGKWAGRAANSRGGSPDVIGQLPGTEKEVTELKDLLRKDGWVTTDHKEREATEAAIKAMNNPKIFHIATHGFFQPDADLSGEDIAMNDNLAAQNPLLKTGLLMSGAGDILNETTSNFNVDDGILTAYEAMNLNLDKTDLVVLSACETGLGEIQAGEGVYGLQRAFLVAGARTIIMSLFKVSDEATQKLMVKFYSKWLETGDKRASFIQAKQEIRDEYKDPIFWGPFIMIGLD